MTTTNYPVLSIYGISSTVIISMPHLPNFSSHMKSLKFNFLKKIKFSLRHLYVPAFKFWHDFLVISCILLPKPSLKIIISILDLVSRAEWCSVWPDWAIYWTLGNFLKNLATINSPTPPPFLGNFCKGVQICHICSEIIFGQLL